MAQSLKVKQIKDIIDKNPTLNSIDDSRMNMVSNKTLSPFHWTNINIKLPKIKNQASTFQIIEEKPKTTKNIQLNKTKTNLKDKLLQINKTIDVAKTMQSRKQTKSEYVSNSKNRYKKQSIDTHKSINLQHPKRSIEKNFKQRHHIERNAAEIQAMQRYAAERLRVEKQRLENKQEKIKQFKRELITRHLNKQFQQQIKQKPKQPKEITYYFSRLKSPMSNFPSQNISPLTFSYNKMQTYVYKGLVKANWCEIGIKNNDVVPQLAWSSHYMDNTKIKSEQIHNHIYNAHFLTTKNHLHQLQSANGSNHYPQSFLMPQQYDNFCQQYEQYVIKLCLKQIIANAYQVINTSVKSSISLGLILNQIGNKKNVTQDSYMALRLCLYLENYRKIKNYRYFQNSQNYVPIHTQIQQSVLANLFKACYQYWQNIVENLNKPNKQTPSLYFKVQNIDIDILHVLWGYHCMLLKFQENYQNLSKRNLWIVKPIASSRGAGISLLKNSNQFFTIYKDRSQLTNKSKFSNKIIQKYIEQPLLLKNSQNFKDRKFDIRQWVLVTCDKQTNEPLIYVYQDAYCRFSDSRFTYNHNRSDQYKIHLTNYSVSDKTNPQNSLMILSEIYQQYPELKAKYEEQISKIVVESIMNAKDIKFQKNRFQLLGYDVMFDRNQKLWLLQINLNPACQSSRSTKLEKIADKMVGNMLKIVKAASGKICISKDQRPEMGWRIVYGIQNFEEADLQQVNLETKIKPFYELSLGNQSLIQQVRRRNLITNATVKIVTIFYLRQVWSLIKQFKKDAEIKQEPKQQQKQSKKQQDEKEQRQP